MRELGRLSALRGQAQAGLDQIRRARELLDARSGTSKQDPQAHPWKYELALGYELAGRSDDALAIVLPAIELMEQSGADLTLAKLLALKARLLEAKSNSKEAENSFRISIEIARSQNAKSLELQATTSLARLLAKQGRRDEGRAMLSEIYDWFTEGLHTADLKDAKTLLDELAQPPKVDG